MSNDPLGLGIAQAEPPDQTQAQDSSPAQPSAVDPLGLGVRQESSPVGDSYREASQHSADDIASAQHISSARGVDPNYTLANLPEAKKAHEEPDWNLLKITNPWTHKFFSDAINMGKAWDDHKPLSELEGHGQAQKKATNLLQALESGFQGQASVMLARGKLPDYALDKDATILQESASAIGGLPEMMAGGAAGALLGPAGAVAGGFVVPAAARKAILDQYTKGDVKSVEDLMNRAGAAAMAGGKSGIVGASMELTGAGAAAYGLGKVTTKLAEIGALTTASAAVEGRTPSMRELVVNGITLLGAHVAGITYRQLADTATSSKTRARDKQAFGQHADNVAPPLSISAEAWDAKLGPDAEHVANTLGLGDKYRAAKQAQGKMDLLPSEYLSKDFDAYRDKFAEGDVSEPGKPSVNEIVEQVKEAKEIAGEKPEGPKMTAPPAGMFGGEAGAEKKMSERYKDVALNNPELYYEARLATRIATRKQASLDELGQQLAESVGGTWEGRVKRPANLTAKVIRKVDKENKPDYDVLRAKDLAAGTIVAKDWGQLQEIAKQLQNSGKFKIEVTVDRPLNRFGYRGVQGEYDLGDGISGEIQLHTPEFNAMRKETHDIYDKWRDDGEADVAAWKASGDARYAEITKDYETSRGKYDAYWDKIPLETRRALSSLEMGREDEASKSLSDPGSAQDFPSKTINSLGDIQSSLPSDKTEMSRQSAAEGEGAAGSASGADSVISSSKESVAGGGAKRKYLLAEGERARLEKMITDGPDIAGRRNYLVMAEAVPSPESKHALLSAPLDVKQEFTGRALPIFKDVMDAYGLKSDVAIGSGVFEGGSSPNVLAGIDPEHAPEEVGALARGMQFVFRQKAVPWAKADPVGPIQGVRIDFNGLTPDREARFRELLTGALTKDQGYTKLGDSISVVNYGGMDATKFAEGIARIGHEHGQELGIGQASHFQTGGDYGPEHDWSKDRDGRELLDQASGTGRPDLQNRLLASQAAQDQLLAEYSDGQSHPTQTPLQQRQQATSQAVDQASHDIGLNDHLPVPGLDARTQTQLDRLHDAARKEAEQMLMKPQLEELKARNKALLKDERDRAEQEITNQVANEPVYRAFSLLKMNRPDAWRQATKYMNGKLDEGDQLAFDAISEMSGFSSGDEMAKKLLLTDPATAFPAEVGARVKAHMAQFADLKDTEALKAEALKAVHTDKSGELLALQQQVYEGLEHVREISAAEAAQRAEQARARWQQVKQFARETIGSTPVQTAGRFQQYYTAERNAAVKAAKLLKDGKIEDAAAAKQAQLTNHALAMESMRIADHIEKWHESIQKAQGSEQAGWKSQDHFFQAANIMRRFGFERPDFDPASRDESLSDWATKYGDIADIPAWLADESVSKSWKTLKPGELRDVSDALKNIKFVANQENKMFVIGRGEIKSMIVDRLHDAKVENADYGKTPGAGTYASPWQKLTHAKDALVNAIIAPETFMSELDGFKRDGPWQEAFTESKNRAMDSRAKMNAADADALRDIYSMYSAKELHEMRTKPIHIPELDPKGRFTKDNILTIAANQGTEGNRTMLAEGRGWTQEQIDSVLAKHMTKKDWDHVQAKLDYMNNVKRPLLGDLHQRVTGFEPQWVEGTPIQTPFGQYKGGYYPLISDPRVVSRGFENMRIDATLADPPPTFKAATQQGFTKQRNENARYAVSLDGNGFVRHISDVTHDLAMREWVIDAQRVLSDKTVAADVQDAFGMENYQGLKTWLKQIAGNDVKPLREAIDGIVSDVRRRTTVSQLGGKLSVMFSQIHGLTAAASVDPENFGRTDVAAGIMNTYGKMLLQPSSLHDMMRTVDEKSPYMMEAGKDADRDIAEAARAQFGEDARVMNFAQSGFRMMHDLTMKPIWMQAYKVGLRLHEGDEAAAVSYADKIIRGSTTGGRSSDLPALMRSSETGKLLTMFHGFVNAQTQLMYKAYGRTHSAADIPAFLGTYMNVMVMPGAMYALFHYGLPDDKKSTQQWEKAMIRSASPLSFVPIVATLQDWAIDKAVGLPGHTSLSPAGGGLDALADLFNQATSRKAHTQKVLESATRVASYTGLPIPASAPGVGNLFMAAYPDQLNTWLWNTVDAVHNGMQPRPSDLMKRRPLRERGQ